jgi:protein subunit release factor A
VRVCGWKENMMLRDEDLDTRTWPERGGGQQAGTVTGVKIVHLPSGITAFVNIGRSQLVNREIARDMILSAITHPKYR